MWPFPKKYFQWREPREARRIALALDDLRSRWWHRPLTGFVLGCILMTSWALSLLNPKIQPLSFEAALAFAFSAGPFWAYLTYWLYRLAPWSVTVFSNQLIRNTGGNRSVNFKRINSVTLHDCGSFRVLVLELRRGQPMILGVPPEIDAQALEDFFTSKGLWVPAGGIAAARIGVCP
jgi:hypothetical protein